MNCRIPTCPTVPRRRGDEPAAEDIEEEVLDCSPQARG